MKKIGNVTYWRDPDLEGIEACRVEGSRHIFPNHAHDGIYAVGLMEKGGSWCLGRSRDEAHVAAGQIALINPGQVHSGEPSESSGITYSMIYVELDRLKDSAGEVCEKAGTVPEFNRMVARNPALFNQLMALRRMVGRDGSLLHKQTTAFEAVADLLTACSGINAACRKPGSRRRAVRQAREFLAEELDRKLSLAEVAAAVGLSRYHFLRVFKQETGLSPHVFRTQRRIDAARRLLKSGMPFSMVALDTGFSDQSHFTNKFRQFMGATPRQYVSG